MEKTLKQILASCLACFLCLAILRAQTMSVTPSPLATGGSAAVTLAWTLSTANNITSQTLSYGVQSGTYTNSINLGAAVAQYQVTNLVYGTTYYFAVKCTDANNLSSVYSTQLMYTTTNAPPPNPPPAPTGLKVLSVP